MAVAFSTCPLCEATCGLEITVADGAVTGIRGDADDVFSHGFVCPKGASLRELHEDPDRLRTPLIREPGGDLRAGVVGRGVRRDRPPPARRSRPSTAATRSPPTSATRRAHNLAACIYGRVAAQGAADAQHLQRQHRRPVPQADGLGADVRQRRDGRRARRRPHRPPAHPRRQPAGLQRQPADRARHARAPARDPRARRQGRRRRPAAHAHRARGRRAPLHPPGHRRAAALRARARALRRGPRRPARARGARRRARRRSRALAARLRARGRRAATCGIAAPDDPAHGARAGGRAAAPRSTGASAPRRSASARPRAGSSTCSTSLTGNLDRPGGAMFPRTAAGVVEHGRRARARPRRAPSGAGTAACAAWARSSASCRSACLAEEIETPGEGQVRALMTIAGNPAVEHAERRAPGRGARARSTSWSASTSTSTRRRATPTSSSRRRRRCERSHYDLALYGFAVRNVANYSPPVLAPDPDMPAEWETLLRLTGVVTGQGAERRRRRDRPLRRARDRAPPDGRRALARPRPRPRGAAGRGRAARRPRAHARPAAARRRRTG